MHHPSSAGETAGVPGPQAANGQSPTLCASAAQPWHEIEELVPLKSPRLLGLREHPNTLKRWADKESKAGGLYSYRTGRRVYLEATRRGRMLYTSTQRVLVFFRELNGIKV